MSTGGVFSPGPTVGRVKRILGAWRVPMEWFAQKGLFPVLSSHSAGLVGGVACPPLIADRFVTTLLAHLRANLFVTLIDTVTVAPSSGLPGVTLRVVPSTRRSA